MAIEREDFACLIPHQGAMCLLDRVVHWEEQRLVAVSDTHASPNNPLRRAGRLSAIHALEYGAQAMAVHGGLRARRDGREPGAGFLAAGRDLRFHVSRLDNLAGSLRIEVAEQYAQSGNMIYRFDIYSDRRAIAGGTAVVVGIARPEAH